MPQTLDSRRASPFMCIMVSICIFICICVFICICITVRKCLMMMIEYGDGKREPIGNWRLSKVYETFAAGDQMAPIARHFLFCFFFAKYELFAGFCAPALSIICFTCFCFRRHIGRRRRREGGRLLTIKNRHQPWLGF